MTLALGERAQALGRPLILGHRGASALTCENTMAAFSLAQKVDWSKAKMMGGTPVIHIPFTYSTPGAKGGRRAAAGCAGWEQPRSRDLARASERLAALAWRRMCSRRIARINTTRGSPPRWASSQLSTSSLRRIT